MKETSQKQRGPFDPIGYTQARPWSVFAIWAAYVAASLAWYCWRIPGPPDFAVGTGDPDVLVRLGLVRDWLQGGGWYNHLVAGTNAPFGTVSPWTRPMDVLLGFFTLIQPAAWPLRLRLLYAAGMVPVLLGWMMLWGIWKGARGIVPLPQTAWYTVFVFGLTIMFGQYFKPGNGDHHGLMAVCWVWALVLILSRQAGHWSAAAAGSLVGLIVWISPEGVGMAAILLGWYAVLWTLGHPRGGQMMPMAWALALTVLTALMVERPPEQWLTPIYDSISIVHVVLFVLAALGATLLCLLPNILRNQRFKRLIWLGVPASVCVTVMAICYPDFFRGPLVGVDPFIFTDFLPAIREAKPLLSDHSLFTVAFLMPSFCLFATAGWIAYRKLDTIFLPWQLGLLTFALIGTLALTLVQRRWMYYFFPPQILLMIPLLVASQFPRHISMARFWPAYPINTLSRRWENVAGGAAPFFLLLLPTALFFMGDFGNGASAAVSADRCVHQARSAIQHGLLNRLTGEQTIVTSTDLGGEVMFYSPHRIIASNYHREGPGIRYIWQAEEMTDAQVLHQHLMARHVQALLICPTPRATERTLFHRWLMGEALPDWLEKVGPGPVPVKKPRQTLEETPLLLRLRP